MNRAVRLLLVIGTLAGAYGCQPLIAYRITNETDHELEIREAPGVNDHFPTSTCDFGTYNFVVTPGASVVVYEPCMTYVCIEIRSGSSSYIYSQLFPQNPTGGPSFRHGKITWEPWYSPGRYYMYHLVVSEGGKIRIVPRDFEESGQEMSSQPKGFPLEPGECKFE